MGGFMKILGSNLGRAVIFGAFLLAFPTLRASAQSPSDAPQADAALATQSPRIPARVTQAINDSSRVTLRGNVHRLARAEFDRGAVSGAQLASHVAIVLKRSDEQEAALRQLLDQQQDKSSPNYHKWLTPDQFGKQFGPADSDVQAVTDWLTSRGFTNIKVNPGRTRVEFSGNVAQVSSAFQTQIHHFFVNGKMHVANVSDPQIPAALSPVVGGVVSLHDFRPHALSHRLGTFRRTKDTGVVKPLFTFGSCGSSTPCYAVGPGDFAKIYSVPSTISATSPGVSGIPGTGVTIAIVQDSNIDPADISAFQTMFGLPANPVHVILNGPDPGIQGPLSATDDEIEADLDTQWANAVAPGAQIDLVVSQDSESIGMFGTDLSAIYIVDNNIAPILSESFGTCEANITAGSEPFYIGLWQQAAAQGITAILSSGDSGSAGCDPDGSSANQDVANHGIAVGGLASTIYNVALGGTDFQNAGPTQNSPSGTSNFWNATNATSGSFLQTSAKGYIPEWPWNDSCAATATTGSLGTCTAAIINPNSDPSAQNFGIDVVAAGGGPSSLVDTSSNPVNPKPNYQSGINGMPTANFRQVPDISLFSGNGTNASFYVICQQDANSTAGSSCDLTGNNFTDFQGVGGTSAAAPAFAGIMAMVNQQTGQRQGNANYILYQLYKNNAAGTICASAANPAGTCIFYDTVLGNNSVACAGGSPNCSNATSGQFGVLVDPTATTKPAFITKTGYDNATGLGSVNVGNLLTAWSGVSLSASTVTITCSAPGSGCSSTSPININHGDSVTFKGTVTPTPPAGTAVSLIATPAGTAPDGIGIGAFSENADFSFNGSNNSFQITTTQLPGGATYPVVVRYSGDNTHLVSTSSAVTVTVAKEASATAVNFVTFDSGGTPTINPPSSSIAYGGSYILQITVTNLSGQHCSDVTVACPTGTLTVTDNGQPLKDFSGTNVATLNSAGFAEDQPVQLAVGTHSIVATYSGDNSFNASTSAAKTITITGGNPTTVAITTQPSKVVPGTPTTIIATISTNSSGVGPTGSVVFKVNGTQVGNAVAVTSTAGNTTTGAPAFATASTTFTFTSTGSNSVDAAFTTGDGNYASSDSGNVTVNVTNSGTTATTTALTAGSTTVASGATVMLTATVTGSTKGGASPTGTIQFMNGTQALGSPQTCTPVAGTSTTGGGCTASLSQALSNVPPGFVTPSRAPRIPPAALLDLAACVLALLLIVGLRRSGVPARRRLGYAFACALVMIGVTAAFAGCGGGSSGGGGGGSHVDSITAVYSGDATYAGSTSTAVAITVTTK